MQEGVFNEVAQFVRGLHHQVVAESGFSWGMTLPILILGLFEEGIAVITMIGEPILGAQTFDQTANLRAICRGTWCHKDSDRQTKRIHGQVDLGVEPPWVRLMSGLPPLAPAAGGWTLP